MHPPHHHYRYHHRGCHQERGRVEKTAGICWCWSRSIQDLGDWYRSSSCPIRTEGQLHFQRHLDLQPGQPHSFRICCRPKGRVGYTVGAYLWTARRLPGLVGTGITTIVLLILEGTEAIAFAVPIERAAWTIIVCVAWNVAIGRLNNFGVSVSLRIRFLSQTTSLMRGKDFRF